MSINSIVSAAPPELSAPPELREELPKVVIIEQPRAFTVGRKVYIIKESRHSFFHSPFYGGCCVPWTAFGAFAVPLIVTPIDTEGEAIMDFSKFVVGALAGSVLGTAVGFGLSRAYNYIFPPSANYSETSTSA